MGLTEIPDEEIRQEVAAALDLRGFAAARMEPISPLHGSKRGRYTFVAEAADGSRIKARRFPDAESAAEQEDLRRGLEPAFAPVLARHGGILLELWVEGSEVGDDASAEVVAEAGALLARLHSMPPRSGDGRARGTSDYRQEAESDLETLVGSGALSGAIGEAIAAEIASADPGEYLPVLIHRDVCAENLVVDEEGRLTVIDNERFTVGAAGFDLGRTHHRWQLPEADWQGLLGAYREAGGIAGELEFWLLITNVSLARIYQRASPERLPAMLARLAERSGGGR